MAITDSQIHIWGADWPRLKCSDRQAVTVFAEGLPWRKGADLEAVMGRGISVWLGWPEDM